METPQDVHAPAPDGRAGRGRRPGLHAAAADPPAPSEAARRQPQAPSAPASPGPAGEGALVLRTARTASAASAASRASTASPTPAPCRPRVPSSLDGLPNELLMQILGYLDVDDLLSASRTSHHLRCLCVAPVLHTLRLRHTRASLQPLLTAPQRPSLSDLASRRIFMSHNTVVSRQLVRSLVRIRLSRHLATRPPVHVLVQRSVMPPECAPGIGHVSPALAARARAVEREKVKDGLRRWVGAVLRREVERRGKRLHPHDEGQGAGRVWRMRRFWERVGRGS